MKPPSSVHQTLSSGCGGQRRGSETRLDVSAQVSLWDTYLCCRDVLDCRLLLQVPDDHQASSVADDHMAGVQGVFLQSLHVLQVPAADVVMWYAAMTTQNQEGVSEEHQEN